MIMVQYVGRVAVSAEINGREVPVEVALARIADDNAYSEEEFRWIMAGAPPRGLRCPECRRVGKNVDACVGCYFKTAPGRETYEATP